MPVIVKAVIANRLLVHASQCTIRLSPSLNKQRIKFNYFEYYEQKLIYVKINTFIFKITD